MRVRYPRFACLFVAFSEKMKSHACFYFFNLNHLLRGGVSEPRPTLSITQHLIDWCITDGSGDAAGKNVKVVYRFVVNIIKPNTGKQT